MKFTTPVSMPCTEAQYNELKPLLEAMGYIVEPIVNRGFIATNVSGQDNYVDNLDEGHVNLNNRTFIPTYNKDLFLALAAMTDEPNGIAGEWWKCINETGLFKVGNIYKAASDITYEAALITDNGMRFGNAPFNHKHFTKATVSEIFAHFGVSYGKEQDEPIQPEIPQPKPMLELKQIDDNTIEYNGKLFKHTGEDVVSPLVQFVELNTPQQDEVLFVAEDGVSITKGMPYWYVEKITNRVVPIRQANLTKKEYTIPSQAEARFSTEQAAQAYVDSQKTKIPTLAEVFKKVQPKYYINEDNTIGHYGDSEVYGSNASRNQLSTESQVKQLQAWIALRVIADWANNEAAWMPTGSYYAIGVDLEVHHRDLSCLHIMEIAFKQRDHAEAAISILKEAELLDALKG